MRRFGRSSQDRIGRAGQASGDNGRLRVQVVAWFARPGTPWPTWTSSVLEGMTAANMLLCRTVADTKHIQSNAVPSGSRREKVPLSRCSKPPEGETAMRVMSVYRTNSPLTAQIYSRTNLVEDAPQ